MTIGLFSAALAYFLGRIIFGKKPAIIFAVLVSTYWLFIYFEGELLDTALSVTLSLAVIYALCLWCEKIKFHYVFLSGVLLGVSALIRPNILLFAPLVFIWTLWVLHRRKKKTSIAATWLGFTFGAALLVLPVTIRNYVIGHDKVLISSNLGINLYIGNNETSSGTCAALPGIKELTGLDEWTCFDYPLIVRGVEQTTGKKMKYSEVSSYYSKKASDYILNHKLKMLKLLAVKTAQFWGPTELPNNKELYLEKLNSRTFRYMPGFPMALSLGLVGIIQLFLFRRNKRKLEDNEPYTDAADIIITEKQYEMSVLIILFVVSYFISVLPFFIVGRFRVPVIPFLFLFGGYGLYRTGKMFSSRNFLGAAIWIIVYIAIYLLGSIQIIPFNHNESEWHLRRANCYRLAQKNYLALEECIKAVKLNPYLEKGQHRLADLLFQKKDYAGAIEHYNLALQIDPDQFDSHYNLALAYKSSGHIDAAIDQYVEALKIRPDYTNARRRLAVDLLNQSRYDEAIAQFKELIKQNPSQAELYNSLAIALKSNGLIDEAIENYKTAIKIDPNYYQAYNNLGNTMLVQNKFDDAISYYRQALKIKPDYTDAQRNLDIVLRSINQPDQDK